MPGDESLYAANVEKQLEGPMPWIGMYVAAAYLICTLAMAADTFNGFRRRKFWFPIKFFSMNATSLTLLAVAMKLPVDLTTRMYAPTDRLAKVSSLIFMSTAIGNLVPCLGFMDDKDILMNVTALGILVITVIVNVCIQIVQMRDFIQGREMVVEEVIAAIFMLLLLVTVASSAIMVSTTKRYLESKFHEMFKMASDEQLFESVEEGTYTFDSLRVMIQKYWMMAATSCPQFVIARSVACTASGIICLLVASLLVEAEVRMVLKYYKVDLTASLYGWSVKWIVLAQSIGVAVGTIAPAFRWFTAINFKFYEKRKSFRDEFKIDAYWTQRLVEWKESSLPMQIRDHKWRKFLHHTKGLILNFVIRIQILTVFSSKVVLFISVCFASPIISCFHCIKMLKNVFDCGPSQIHGISESKNEFRTELDLTRYIILLEGEVELPQKTIIDICNEVDKVIQTGKKQQPKNLIKLLQKVGNFRGLREVDGGKVPSLHSQEPPPCWSLPLVTLTSIAIALPNVPKHNVEQLIRSVDEGLFYVKLIEKSLDKKGNLANSRSAADVIWVQAELYRKWQNNDLYETSLRKRNSKDTLQELSNKAEKTIVDFKKDVKDLLMENPLNWPVKVIAANSMYRVCKRLLKAYEGDHLQTDHRLFEQLRNMIANITAACLTNLMSVIIMKCHHKAINEKAKSVRQAALLLGETEEILQILQQHQATRSDPEESAFIEKWRHLIKRKI